jgi:hypothetical protein
VPLLQVQLQAILKWHLCHWSAAAAICSCGLPVDAQSLVDVSRRALERTTALALELGVSPGLKITFERLSAPMQT